MPNLVTVTKESRLILKIGGIACGLILIFYIIFQSIALVQRLYSPPPPPLQAFGKLPPMSFPENEESKGLGIEYRINTLDGLLPFLGDRVNIYKLEQPEPNLLALDDAKNTLLALDFVDNQVKVSDTLYRWSQSRTGIVIEYDIVSKNFAISSNYLANPFLSATSMIPSEDEIKNDLLGYLASMNVNTEHFDSETSTVQLLELKNGTLSPAENIGNARFARVTLSQKEIDKLPIAYGGGANSILSFIISYPDNRFQILEGEFYNHMINLEEKSDYPIITTQQAFEELKNGNAYIVNSQSLSNVDITDVKLKYYLGRETTEYLMPVIEFSGNNFTAYVSAIPSTSIGN